MSRRTLAGSRAIVTGASSGIGHALVVELAREGVGVVAGARRADRLAALADEIRSAGRAVETVAATGSEVTGDTIPVSAAWNMIGTISNPVPVASIVQNPASNVTSYYYGYNGAYVTEDTLEPGRSYWVKVTQAGTLALLSSAAVPKQVVRQADEWKNSLTFADARGHRQTLYFGSAKPGEGLARYELPPVPPEGGFDARFGSGRSAEVVAATAQQTTHYPITVQSSYPLTMSWSIDAHDANVYTLSSPDGALVQRLTGQGERTEEGSVTSLELSVAGGKPLPASYSLGQNYPNPFNPTTIIPFALPRASAVSLKLFNMLGEEVATLLDNVQRDAGYYETSVNASRLSSGMYFYRFVATSSDEQHEQFQRQRKLLLIK